MAYKRKNNNYLQQELNSLAKSLFGDGFSGDGYFQENMKKINGNLFGFESDEKTREDRENLSMK